MDDQKVVIYKDTGIRVYHYKTGEIFVENLWSGVVLRIGRTFGHLRATTQNGQLQPWAINGLPAFIARN